MAHARRQGGDGVTKGVAGVPTTEPMVAESESVMDRMGGWWRRAFVLGDGSCGMRRGLRWVCEDVKSADDLNVIVAVCSYNHRF